MRGEVTCACFLSSVNSLQSSGLSSQPLLLFALASHFLLLLKDS